MSRWTHPICEACWNEQHPDRKTACSEVGDEETCYFCGFRTTSGIYVREDPTKTKFCEHDR